MAKYLTQARISQILQKLAPWFVDKEAEALVELADEAAGNAYDQAFDLYEILDDRVTALEAGGGEVPDHTHPISDVEGLQAALDSKAGVVHTHAQTDVVGLSEALESKSDVGHGHAIADVTGLQAALDSKSNVSHNHDGVYEPAGAVATHVAASDPHPQYLTQTEGDARYQLLGGSSGITWTTVNANTAMTNDSAYVVTGARDMTLPASVATGKWFIVHAYDAVVRVVSNGNVINGVGSGNDLTLEAGETAYLVARTTGQLEIV